jgi:hypothetical protein
VSARPPVSSELRRPVVLGALACALAVAGVISATATTPRPSVAPQSDAVVAASAQSSAFYCAGLEDIRGSVTSQVAIADLARSPRIVELTTADSAGHVAVRELRVDPGSVAHVSPGNYVRGDYVAMTVDASGGGVAVSEALRSVNGSAVTPCLSEASASWWVTGGSTEPGQSFVVAVFNPNESRAVATVTLETPSGLFVPSAYAGLVLGPHTLEALWVHDVAPNESPITAHVKATDGDVVVYGVGLATQHQTSVSLLAASPGPSRTVVVPSASTNPSLSTSLLFAGIGSDPVTATVQVLAPSGCTTRCPAPFTVSVPAGSTTSLTLSPTSRVPLDEQIAAVVTAPAPGVIVTEHVSTLGGVGQSAPLYDPTFAGGTRLVLVDPLGGTITDVGVVNPTGHAVSVRLETVTRRGPHLFGASYVVAAHSDLVLGGSALRGVDDGVLELVADGDVSAAAQVRGATQGAATLAAAPE